MSQEIIVTQAELSDAEEIIKISQANLVSNKKDPGQNLGERGFLIIPITKEEVSQQILDPKNHIILTAKNNGETLGYLVAYDLEIAEENLKNTLLNSIKNLEKNFHKILYYKQIAKNSQLPGIGSALFKSMLNQAKNQNYQAIICQIVQQPFLNKISTQFHQKLGFQKIGSSKRGEITLGIFVLEL